MVAVSTSELPAGGAGAGSSRGGIRGCRSTRRPSTTWSVSCTPRTCWLYGARYPEQGPRPLGGAAALLHTGVEEDRRAAARDAAGAGAHGDRAGRVRRHGRVGDDRGPAGGDRRRDPGRVRRRGEADRELSDQEAIFDARVSIHDVNDTLAVTLADGEYDTVGGLVYDRLGKIPVVGDEVAGGRRLADGALDGRQADQEGQDPHRTGVAGAVQRRPKSDPATASGCCPAARRASRNAYAPYSGFAVGARSSAAGTARSSWAVTSRTPPMAWLPKGWLAR